MNTITTELQRHWQALRPMLAIHSESQYDAAVERLHELIDLVGTDPQHPLYDLLDTLGTVMRAYEEQHHDMPTSNGAGMLRFLMDEHALTQSDLNEIGSQGVVSEVLNGKRNLNVRQIRLLAKRFGVSPAVFI